MIDLAKEVSKVIGSIPIKIGAKKEADKRSYRVDFTKFSNLAPEINIDFKLDATIINLAEGIKNIKFLNKNFRDSDFIRLNMLKKYIKMVRFMLILIFFFVRFDLRTLFLYVFITFFLRREAPDFF